MQRKQEMAKLVRNCETVLRSDEWYNDYAVKAGVGDIIGTRLFGNPSYTVILSVHRGSYQEPFDAISSAQLQKLFDPLSNAARLHAELRELGWKSAAALRALDQVAAGLIISDGDGRVVEMNWAAEHVLRRDDGLTVRQGSCVRSASLITRSLLGPSPAPPMGNPRPRSDACLLEGAVVEWPIF
jgi:hypothetical protein